MADVTFTFSGDATSLKNALDDIKNQINQAKQSVNSLAGQFTACFVGAQAAIAGMKKAFDWISNVPAQAARLEDLHTQFTPLMGDAEKAGKLLNDLWKSAASGAVSLEGMAAAARPLVHVFSDNKTVHEWTRRLADIEAGSSASAESIAKLYSRAVQLGKVEWKSIDVLAKKGLPIYEELGAVMNTSAMNIMKMAKEGQVSVDQYAAALRRMTDEGGAYYKLSTAMSNTTKGSWDTLMESINLVCAQLGKPINDAIRPLLQELSEHLDSILPKVAEFAESFVAGLQQVAAAVGPVLGFMGDFIGLIGGAKTVLAAAAAAVLMYASNTAIATKSTTQLTGQVFSLSGALSKLNVSSVVAAMKTGFGSILGYVRATGVGLRSIWSITMTTMAVATRTAMIAIKAAIVSTGIGILVVGIGEALGALYSWWMGNEEAAIQAADAAKAYSKVVKSLEKEAADVKSYEQLDSLVSSIDEHIEQLREKRADAEREDNDALASELSKQIKSLYDKKAYYEETLPLQVEAARKAEQEAAAYRKQREEAEALAEKMQEARSKLADLVAQQKAAEREQLVSNIKDSDIQIKVRLSDAGHTSVKELQAEMAKLEERSRSVLGVDAEELARYEKLSKVLNTVRGLQIKSAEEEKKKREEAEKAKASYEDKIALLKAEISQDEKRINLIKQEQRIAELTAEYRRQGFANALDMAKQLVALEQKAEEAKKKADEKRKADEKKQKEDGSSRMSATTVQDSKAAVGGGGRSIVIGGPLLTESKKQTSLLGEVRDAVKNSKPTINVSGNVTAVIGK